MIKENCEDDLEVMEQETENITGRSDSNRRQSSSHVTEQLSNNEYIKQLQEEINRLRGESSRTSKYQRQQRHRKCGQSLGTQKETDHDFMCVIFIVSFVATEY